jgi:hypothetical protein
MDEKPVRRVRAGQPPPIFIDPIESDKDEDTTSDSIVAVVVVLILALVAAGAALVLRVLP